MQVSPSHVQGQLYWQLSPQLASQLAQLPLQDTSQVGQPGHVQLV
jgi:hypothetical protein